MRRRVGQCVCVYMHLRTATCAVMGMAGQRQGVATGREEVNYPDKSRHSIMMKNFPNQWASHKAATLTNLLQMLQGHSTVQIHLPYAHEDWVSEPTWKESGSVWICIHLHKAPRNTAISS